MRYGHNGDVSYLYCLISTLLGATHQVDSLSLSCNCMPLCHAKRILNIPITLVFAWTDSTIVLQATLADSRHTWGIGFHSSLINYYPTDGGMSLALRILPIAPQGDFSLHSSKTTTSGGMAPSGLSSTSLYNQFHYLRPFQRKNERFVI